MTTRIFPLPLFSNTREEAIAKPPDDTLNRERVSSLVTLKQYRVQGDTPFTSTTHFVERERAAQLAKRNREKKLASFIENAKCELIEIRGVFVYVEPEAETRAVDTRGVINSVARTIACN